MSTMSPKAAAVPAASLEAPSGPGRRCPTSWSTDPGTWSWRPGAQQPWLGLAEAAFTGPPSLVRHQTVHCGLVILEEICGHTEGHDSDRTGHSTASG